MTKTNDNQKGIEIILDHLRKFIPNLGVYEKHYLTERFTYLVELTKNGKIEIELNDAKDISLYKNFLLSTDSLNKMKDSFEINQ